MSLLAPALRRVRSFDRISSQSKREVTGFLGLPQSGSVQGLEHQIGAPLI
jgi:hypothetical protein